MAKRHYFLLLPLLLTAIIAISASLPGALLPHWLHHNFDKTVHTVVYGLLAMSWLMALRPFLRSISLAVIITMLLCLTTGFGLEWLQDIIPRRRSDPLDVRADMIGVLVVCGVWWVIVQFQRFQQARQ